MLECTVKAPHDSENEKWIKMDLTRSSPGPIIFILNATCAASIRFESCELRHPACPHLATMRVDSSILSNSYWKKERNKDWGHFRRFLCVT
jgi:hypothetical protein